MVWYIEDESGEVLSKVDKTADSDSSPGKEMKYDLNDGGD